MSGKPRAVRPGIPLHIFQQGLREQQCFFEDRDYRRYLEWMGKYSRDSRCSVHAYILMPSHIRILFTPHEQISATRFMMQLGRRYAHYFNRAYGRRGSLFEKRFRSAMLEDPGDILPCHWYIEHNAVRAMIVDRPQDYPWSSYHANARAEASGLLIAHPFYEELGSTPQERAVAYHQRSLLFMDPGHESTGAFLPLPT